MGLRLKDNNKGIAPLVLLAIAGVASLGVGIFAWKVGSGIETAFTIFGSEISLYVTIGITFAAIFFLWLIFGKK